MKGYKPARIGNSEPRRAPGRKIELKEGFKAEGIVANFNILLDVATQASIKNKFYQEVPGGVQESADYRMCRRV